MQNVIAWNEHQRARLGVQPVEAPANFKIHSFVIGMGLGAYMLMEWTTRSKCMDSVRCCLLSHSRLARPVVPVADAIRVELEAMAYRDGLKSE